MPLLPYAPAPLLLSQLDQRYLRKTGDTLEGDLVFPSEGFVMYDVDDQPWRVMLDNAGDWITLSIIAEATGTPMGLLLALTYD